MRDIAIQLWFAFVQRVFRWYSGGWSMKLNVKPERAVDGAPSQIPTLKFFTPPASRSPSPGHDLGNRMKILFNMFFIFFCENTHKVWYKTL